MTVINMFSVIENILNAQQTIILESQAYSRLSSQCKQYRKVQEIKLKVEKYL